MKDRWSHCLLVFASIAVFFICLEVLLSLFWPHKAFIRSYHEQYHPTLGWVNKPYADGYFYIKRNIRFHRHHNNHGLRSLRDTTYEKPKGIKRILLIGDSFFWGYGVDDEYVISEVMQKLAGNSVEVLNGAVTGYGTDQELLWLIEYGLKYSPDIVILGVFPLNDLDEISHSVMYGYPKPIFSIEEGELKLFNVPVPDTKETRRKAFEEPQTLLGRIKKFLRFHTHTYPFLAKRINAIPGVRPFLLKIGLAEEYTQSLPGVKNLVLKPDMVLPLFNAIIKEIKAVCDENGAQFILVFIPEKENTPGADLKYAGVSEDAEKRNSYYSKYLKDLSSKNRIHFIDLLPYVREKQKEGVFIHNPHTYDHHWTPEGHRLAAEVILQKMRAFSLLRGL
jgi:hypothetical protein